MGMRVTMFFTFWGLNALRRPGSSGRATDWLRRMFGVLNKGGADRLPLSRFHFWGLGTRMMKRVMQQHRINCGDERIRRYQHLVSGADVEGRQSDDQSGSSIGRRQAVL